ncbi:MAG: DAK2 domain-containing protein, partial [Clostridia bacterium]|nr:DAK2 domain-containing protein [Clostridia bacterium]
MEDLTQRNTIDGKIFAQIVLAGALNLKAHLKIVNDLNVFPIPDGDTGDNMFMTINGGISKLTTEQSENLGTKAKALANGMLLNARGNSGVILSQLFAGICSGLANLDTATMADFVKAMEQGIKQAYQAVVRPVEGTILTVARESADFANKNVDENSTLGSYFRDYVKEMHLSLERTPDLLDALKEAEVVDSGGAGLLYIAEGMLNAVEGKVATEEHLEFEAKQDEVDFSKFNENSVMEFGYCTEFLLQLQTSKCDVNEFTVEPLVEYLETLGDSIVAFKTGTIVKVHVHTLTPAKVIEYCQRYGEFLTIKMENMTLQHSNTGEDFATNKKKKSERKPFGIVTVATGKGLTETFSEMGADVVIDGGQGKNPSIERFIEAFDETNADVIFVLPNNSNIIMAAKQASEIYDKSQVRVLPCKNFGQAYGILSMLEYNGDADEIEAQMLENMAGVTTAMVTNAIRTANINGVEINEGEFIGFTDKTMLVSNKTKLGAFGELCEKIKVGE